jgi:cell wall integrity and stress response component
VYNIYQSNGACYDQCSGYAFAVVQYQDCWCSNYIPADQQSTSNCSQDCPGYPQEQCGNKNSGLYGYIAVASNQPSGTAGASSSSASSTQASPSESVSTSSDPPQASSTDSSTSSSSYTSSTASSVSVLTSTSVRLITSSASPSSSSSSSRSSWTARLTSSSQSSTQSTQESSSQATTSYVSETVLQTVTQSPSPSTVVSYVTLVCMFAFHLLHAKAHITTDPRLISTGVIYANGLIFLLDT